MDWGWQRWLGELEIGDLGADLVERIGGLGKFGGAGAYPCVWLESRGSGAEPTLVLGTAPTLLMFGCKYWVGVAPTSFLVWLED
jgi:hypothetical protein